MENYKKTLKTTGLVSPSVAPTHTHILFWKRETSQEHTGRGKERWCSWVVKVWDLVSDGLEFKEAPPWPQIRCYSSLCSA